MAQRRVFVIWSNPLFHESVRRLLSHPQIELVGAACDRAAVLAQVEARQPDVILAEEEDDGRPPASAVEILEAGWAELRVIVLGLANNELRIYHRESRSIGRVEDLLRLIRAD